jgi:N-acetylneuraminic acid mutarotase
MKRINYTLFVLLVVSVVFSCTRTNLNYTENGNWASRTTFGGGNGIGVGYAASFVIGNNAYVATGVNPQFPAQKLQAVWMYTPGAIPANVSDGVDSPQAQGVWTAVANFPGLPRSNAVGFSAAGQGYVGTGLANDGVTIYSDFWAFNPGAGTWTEVDSISDANGNYPRYDAASFSFDSVGYVLTGTDGFNYFGDVWKFSPATGQWIQQLGFPGNNRSGAITFIYQGQGYIVTGHTPNTKWAQGNLAYDFWRFNPNSTNIDITWIRLRDIWNTSPGTYDDGYANIIRTNGAGFVILGTQGGDKAYVTCGANSNTDIDFTWEYDFLTDTWDEKAPFKGTDRTGAVGFTLMNRGFVATGLNAGAQAAYTDTYEFFPNAVYNPYD